MSANFYSTINDLLNPLKIEFEKNIPFVESEIVELTKPSMMGKGGLYYHLETQTSGLAIFFWTSGIFEISSNLIAVNGEDNYTFQYLPQNEIEEMNLHEILPIFIEKLIELLSLLKEKYPDIKTEIFTK